MATYLRSEVAPLPAAASFTTTKAATPRPAPARPATRPATLSALLSEASEHASRYHAEMGHIGVHANPDART
ncbi:hypothetical protein ACFXJ8_41740 [Nonomuraea sp. NPDC059194]|uniref:hypothetical protein n=1 Tax=Nonomuraea sp. NPDC059194 TaxID=3346764 RepID=UPI0036811E61